MNKKSQESNLKDIILALIILFILIGIFAGILHTFPGASETKRCETYVNLASKLKSPFTKETRIDLSKACPTKNVEITKKGSTAEQINENALNQILEQMYLCGKKFSFEEGQIKKNPFSQWKVDNVCVVCSDIKLDDNLPKLEGFLWQQTQSTISNTGISYYQYLKGEPPTDVIINDFNNLKQSKTDFIDPSKQYYVIYAVNMQTDADTFFNRLLGGAALGAAAGTIVGLPVKTAALPFSAALNLLVGKKIRVARGVLYAFTAGGIAYGGYTGINTRAETYVGPDGALLFVPAEDVKDYCMTLGIDPFDPWGDDYE